jgi:hypothetical protein
MLQTPGVQFVNLQYGDSEADLARLTQVSGIQIRRPRELKLKDDLDDLAALCSALHAVVAILNATSMLAGACGAPVVLITGPGSWLQLGQGACALVCRRDNLRDRQLSDWTPALARATEEMRRIVR